MAVKKEFMNGAGYTTVYLVVNMSKFIHADDQKKFENIRGTQPFTQIIRDEWRKLLAGLNSPFDHQEQFGKPVASNEPDQARMNVDDVAFNTGIFKGVVLREYSTPFYKVDKSRFQFNPLLRKNLQFKELFLKNWDRWDIHIRPTMTGMFVIRLTNYYDHKYGTQSAEFRTIASNVQSLQSSFDIPSALEKRDETRIQIDKGIDVEKALDNLDTIQCLLDWLGIDDKDYSHSMDYPRIQWQLAQEVCMRFIESIGYTITLPSKANIRWIKPRKNITSSLNDSYTVYHFNELHAPGRLIERDYWSKEDWKKYRDESFTISYRDLENSPLIKEAVAQLIEGAMLKKPAVGGPENPQKDTRRFPRQNSEKVDRVFEQNFSTWEDELCLLTPRCCVIWPSRNARNDYLYISTLPTATSRVKYLWYWDAMERMIEFVIEVKLLSNLVELESVKALNRFSETLNEMRLGLLEERSDFKREKLSILAKDATNLSRLVGLSRRLSTPQTWSRAEYAAGKATYFMGQLNIPQLINHAETNVDNMTNLINHQDELYLANLSERSNKSNQRLTTTLFLASLALLIFSLPSFWVDATGLFAPDVPSIAAPRSNLQIITLITYWFGNIGTVGIFGYFIYRGIRHWRNKDKIMN